MSALPPMPYRWNGEAMELEPRFRRAADREFVIGATYHLVIHEERSQASHSHYFAVIKAIWESLGEEDAARFLTADHLRRYGLIRSGYRNERTFVCGSNAEAVRMVAFLRPLDEYAIFSVKDAVVVEWTAKSQSYRAMGKEEFQASKDAVIAVLAAMIDVDPEKVTEHVSSAVRDRSARQAAPADAQ